MIRIHNGYQIKPHSITPSCYIVVVDGKGGKIPDILSGQYTTPTIAKEAIDRYISSKEKKV